MNLPSISTPSARRWDILLVVAIVGISIFYTAGVTRVPFHPDEATLIFMSADWETLFSNPARLAWQPNSNDPRQLLRLLDAPLGRYLSGFSRWINGYPSLPVDWNWGASFWANQQSGALPEPGLLTASRLGPAALFPFSLLLMYLTGLRLGGRGLGWLCLLLLATNALVLLHTRRAMAEGGLIFAVCLFMAGLVYFKKRPWLLAIPAALAFCAKQSSLPLAGIGVLAVILASAQPFHWQAALRQVASYGLLLLAGIVLLNPFLWAHPIQALQAAVAARQELLTRQTQEFAQALPDSVLTSPLEVGLTLVVNQFILPPSIGEVGNYQTQTEAAAQTYLANPLNSLLRGLFAGAVLFALCLTGFWLSLRRCLRATTPHRATWVLLALAGALQFMALALTVTLPFQRYGLPLIPFSCIWIGYSLQEIIQPIILALPRHVPMGANNPPFPPT